MLSSVIPTISNNSQTLLLSSSGVKFSKFFKGSDNKSKTLFLGFKDDIESWKIICIFFLYKDFLGILFKFIFSPSNITLPEVTFSRPIIDLPIVDFPLPDSPTKP